MRISDWSSDVCSSDLPQPHHAASAFRSSEPSVKAPRRSRTCPVRPRSEPEPGRRVVAKGDWFSALRMGWSAPNMLVPLPHSPIAPLDLDQPLPFLPLPHPIISDYLFLFIYFFFRF